MGQRRRRQTTWVEALETRRLLSFDPVTAGGLAQSGIGFPYVWAAGRGGSSNSLLIENERLGFVTATGYGMADPSPVPGQSDEPLWSDARFQLKSDGEASPIGTLVIRNSQAAYSRAEALWRTTMTPNAWEQIHNDGFYLKNSSQGTESIIVFQDVDITSIDTHQSVILDGGSARRIYFRNVTWNNFVTIKLLASTHIEELIFDNCQGQVNLQQSGGSIGTIYNTDPTRTRISFSSQSLPVVTGLPADLAQLAPYSAAGAVGVDGLSGGIMEAEDFDTHGEGVSYHDSSAEAGLLYRRDLTNGSAAGIAAPRVDLAAGGSNGWHVTSVRSGEWLDYTIDVEASGMYRVDTLVASAGTGGQMRIGFDGRYVRYGGDTAACYTLPDTQGAYATLSSDAIYLSAGTHVMHVQFSHTAGLAAEVGDFDLFRIVPAPAPTLPPPRVANLRPGNSAGNTQSGSGSRSSINFRWDESPGADGYLIQRSPDGATNWQTIGEVAGSARDAAGMILDFTDMGLQPDTVYYYRVKAYNMAGSSEWSDVAALKTKPQPRAPRAPSNIIVRQGAANRYDFTWTDASDNERSFKVERWNGSIFGVVSGAEADGTAASNGGVSAAASYRYRVAAVNVEGQGYGPALVVPGDAGFESGALSTAWTVATGAASIVPGGSGGAMTAQLAAGAQIQQTLTNLTPHTTYTLLAFARAGAEGTVTIGVKDHGGAAQQTTLGNNAYTAAVVTFTTGTGTSATIFASASGAAGHVDDFQLIEQQPATPIISPDPIIRDNSVTLTWSMASTENLAGFEVWRSTDGRNFIALTAPGRISPTSPWQYTDSSAILQTATTLYYQVRAAQKGDEGASTAAYNRQPNFSPIITLVLNHAPSVPANLQAVRGGGNQVHLTWQDRTPAGTDSSSDEHGLIVERAVDGGDFIEMARLLPNVTRFTDTALPATPGSLTYRYRVRAITSAAVSAPSNEVIVLPSVIAPSDLQAMAAAAGSVSLTWRDNSSNESGFVIERSDDGGKTFAEIARTAADVNNCIDAGLSSSIDYLYRVRACIAGLPDPYSTPSGTASYRVPGPFGGQPIVLPTLIEAEAFDYGGEGVAYHDLDPATNLGNARTLRTNPADVGVDIDASTTRAWVRTVKPTEWLQYTLTVARAGLYRVDFQVASGAASSSSANRFYLLLDGARLTANIALPNTGGWTVFRTLSTYVTLPAGEHVIRLVADGVNAGSSIGNFDWIRFVERATIDDGVVRLSGNKARDRFDIRSDASGQNIEFRDLASTSGKVLTLSPERIRSVVIDTPGVTNIGGKPIWQPGTRLIARRGSTNINSDLGGPAGHVAVTVERLSSVILKATQHLASLSIGAGGRVMLSAAGNRVLAVRSLDIAVDGNGACLGRLDLKNNDLIVQSLPAERLAVLDAVRRMVASGRNQGPAPWMGAGIHSSTAANQARRLTGLAVVLNEADSGVPLISSFRGERVDASSILVKYTWNGDLDLNGQVDADDYVLMDRGLLTGLGGWAQGDIDYSGLRTPSPTSAVDASDYALIDQSFRGQTGVL